MRFLFLLIALILILPSCQKNEPKKELNSASALTDPIEDIKTSAQEKLLKADRDAKVAANEIIEFAYPQSLEELYATKYVVDTLYRKAVPNGEGNDDDEFHMIFNELIGINTSKQLNRNNIFAAKPISYFDPHFLENDQFLYLPFHVEEEREWTIFTVWEKTALGIKFVSYYKHLFINKYGRIRIIDVKQFKARKYILFEEYMPDESGLFRSIQLASVNDQNELEILHKQALGEIEVDTYIPKCFLATEENKVLINLENDSLKHQPILLKKLENIDN